MKFCFNFIWIPSFFFPPEGEIAWVSRDLTILQIPLIVFGISFTPTALVGEKTEESEIDTVEERKEEGGSE